MLTRGSPEASQLLAGDHHDPATRLGGAKRWVGMRIRTSTGSRASRLFFEKRRRLAPLLIGMALAGCSQRSSLRAPPAEPGFSPAEGQRKDERENLGGVDGSVPAAAAPEGATFVSGAHGQPLASSPGHRLPRRCCQRSEWWINPASGRRLSVAIFRAARARWRSMVSLSLGRQSQRYVGREAEVVLNPQTGKVVSVKPTSCAKAARLLGGE